MRFGLWTIGQARGRDVLLAEKPDGHDLLEVVLAREGLPRRTRVLVPTATCVDDFLIHRCRPGAHVELAILEDELAIEDGAPVVVAGATVAAAREPLRLVRPRAFALPPSASWRDLRVYRVDGHTVSVRGAGVHRRLTYVDLGMASEKSREPTTTAPTKSARPGARLGWTPREAEHGAFSMETRVVLSENAGVSCARFSILLFPHRYKERFVNTVARARPACRVRQAITGSCRGPETLLVDLQRNAVLDPRRCASACDREADRRSVCAMRGCPIRCQ